jgi:hypothetical protein
MYEILEFFHEIYPVFTLFRSLILLHNLMRTFSSFHITLEFLYLIIFSPEE